MIPLTLLTCISIAIVHLVEYTNADCCYPIYRCGATIDPNYGLFRGCCHDGFRPWTDAGVVYCGKTSCNALGCNCECRKKPGFDWDVPANKKTIDSKKKKSGRAAAKAKPILKSSAKSKKRVHASPLEQDGSRGNTFSYVDQNGDGHVSFEEAFEMWDGTHGTADQLAGNFEAYDKDGSRGLSYAEMNA